MYLSHFVGADVNGRSFARHAPSLAPAGSLIR
ncbi:MAG: hypothetical protein RLZZ461_1393, partial [Planctomycetota bacterium]